MSFNNLYSAHIGGLRPTITANGLREHFSHAGEVLDVWISPRKSIDAKFTFGFVRFATFEDLQKACRTLNKKSLNNSILEVTISQHTREMIQDKNNDKYYGDNHRDYPRQQFGGSIVRDSMPRNEGGKFYVRAQDEKDLQAQFKLTLSKIHSDKEISKWLSISTIEESQRFMRDFKDVLVNIKDIPYGVRVEPKYSSFTPATKVDLENFIVNYHRPADKPRQLFNEIDIDLTCASTCPTALATIISHIQGNGHIV